LIIALAFCQVVPSSKSIAFVFLRSGLTTVQPLGIENEKSPNNWDASVLLDSVVVSTVEAWVPAGGGVVLLVQPTMPSTERSKQFISFISGSCEEFAEKESL
jgi:hypothetical protein